MHTVLKPELALAKDNTVAQRFLKQLKSVFGYNYMFMFWTVVGANPPSKLDSHPNQLPAGHP